MSKLRKIEQTETGPDYTFECPGCGCYHGVWTSRPNSITNGIWTFNGDINKPTFSPSLLIRFNQDGKECVCHSFVRDGKIQYLGDCTHVFKNQTIELPEV